MERERDNLKSGNRKEIRAFEPIRLLITTHTDTNNEHFAAVPSGWDRLKRIGHRKGRREERNAFCIDPHLPTKSFCRRFSSLQKRPQEEIRMCFYRIDRQIGRGTLVPSPPIIIRQRSAKIDKKKKKPTRSIFYSLSTILQGSHL